MWKKLWESSQFNEINCKKSLAFHNYPTLVKENKYKWETMKKNVRNPCLMKSTARNIFLSITIKPWLNGELKKEQKC